MISELRLDFSRKRKKHKNPNIARLAFYQQSLVFQKLKIDLIGIRICHVYFGTIHVSPVFFVATPVVLLHGNTSRKVKGLFTLDLKKDVGVIAIDFSKPFDSGCHNLTAMLRAYLCQESAISLIQSYLSDHFQRVKCNGFF